MRKWCFSDDDRFVSWFSSVFWSRNWFCHLLVKWLCVCVRMWSSKMRGGGGVGLVNWVKSFVSSLVSSWFRLFASFLGRLISLDICFFHNKLFQDRLILNVAHKRENIYYIAIDIYNGFHNWPKKHTSCRKTKLITKNQKQGLFFPIGY